MKRRSMALLLPVALLFAASEARADSRPSSSVTSPRAFELFGTTVCRWDAPAQTPCDWRLSPPPAPDSQKQPVPRVLELFGLRLCVGEVAPATACDVRLAQEQPGPRDRQASL